MMSKNPLVLSVVVVALFGVSVLSKCEDNPTILCVFKAVLHPHVSVRCLVNTSIPFEKVTDKAFVQLSQCSQKVPPNPAARDFIGLTENILRTLSQIIGSCGNKPNGTLSPGIWCGLKAFGGFVKLRKLLKKAEKSAERLEKFNYCVVKHVSDYVKQIPQFRKDLNYCIFHKQ
ncbi:hypothetical protein AWZ03_009157 [Drosophila navojoa]|uniref:Secreted protein n=1 Tax=Drosophila navojoa TaxID=7232 RepID=A0A484B6T4_DRONA|nr:hypothetical protein AWZ03_009157 [Drosophila navojoa]